MAAALALIAVLFAACADLTPGACDLYREARATHPESAALFDAAVTAVMEATDDR